MPENTIDNELLLIKNVSNGDHAAFQQLFNHYWDRVFTNSVHFLKSRELAHDLTQEVFIRVWITREKLDDVQHFESWLYKIAKHIFLDHLRKHLVAARESDLSAVELITDDLSAQNKLELNELQQHINNAISYLPAQMQTAFKLSRFQGLTHEQIARKMNISKATSQNYVARSLIVIRRHLLQYLGQFLLFFLLCGK